MNTAANTSRFNPMKRMIKFWALGFGWREAAHMHGGGTGRMYAKLCMYVLLPIL